MRLGGSKDFFCDMNYCLVLFSMQLRYIHNSPGGNSSAVANAAIQVRGYIGTPPCLSVKSSLLWRVASMHIADDSSYATVANILTQYQLGPSYIGNFQSVQSAGEPSIR